MKRAILASLLLAALAAPAQANPSQPTHLKGRDCPIPTSTPWRMKPSGCYILARGATVTIPRSATEVDIWSSNLRRHLMQKGEPYAGNDDCPQWGFTSSPNYAAGWVTCNRDIFNYRRAIIAYYWRG